jgi:hypothetical protein
MWKHHRDELTKPTSVHDPPPQRHARRTGKKENAAVGEKPPLLATLPAYRPPTAAFSFFPVGLTGRFLLSGCLSSTSADFSVKSDLGENGFGAQK